MSKKRPRNIRRVLGPPVRIGSVKPAARKAHPTARKTSGKTLKIGATVKHQMCGSPLMIRAYRVVWLGWCACCKEEVRYEAFTA